MILEFRGVAKHLFFGQFATDQGDPFARELSIVHLYLIAL